MAVNTRFAFLAPLALAGIAAVADAGGCSASADSKAFPDQGDTEGSGGGSSSQSGGGGKGGGELQIDGGGGGGPSGGVPQTCAQALEQQSYIGCEYWPTVTSNSGLYVEFSFAIVAANPTDSDATVKVTKGGAEVAEVTVHPKQLETIQLPWVDELKQEDVIGDGSDLGSVIVKHGAYKVTSSVPITLYQFNPLEFELTNPPFDCPQMADFGGCYSFTNDASLLLPTTALRGDYYVMSYPTLHLGFFGSWSNLPGFVAVTATEDGTTVDVKASAHVRPGNGVDAFGPGQHGSYDLDAGDVLMLLSDYPPDAETPQPGKPCEFDDVIGVTYCPSGDDYDLTGTRITATKPVSVVGGHNCSFVPYNHFACDHLEESLFPIDVLGQDLIVTAPQSPTDLESVPGTPDNEYIRVLSAADGNKITFDPAVHGKVTLDAGEWLEIGPLKDDVRIQGTDKILVGQYMVGEEFTDVSAGEGDPSLSIAIPTEQYRLEYTFLAPSTYTHNFVNVVAPPGSNITIDGATIGEDEFKAVGASGQSVARHQIDGGAHSMKGDKNFGIVVYGYGEYTSYMYPGGLNLETITIVPH